MARPKIEKMTPEEMVKELVDARDVEEGVILDALLAHATESSKAFNSTFRKPLEAILEEQRQEAGEDFPPVTEMDMDQLLGELHGDYEVTENEVLSEIAESDKPALAAVRALLEQYREDAAEDD